MPSDTGHDAPREDFGQYLTDDLKLLFGEKGYEIVLQEVLDNRYASLNKRKAAIAWLRSQRRKERKRDNSWKVFAVVGSILAALLGAYVGSSINASTSRSIQNEQIKHERAVLVATIRADVLSLVFEEDARQKKLESALGQLISVEACSKKVQGIPRPWLMPSVPINFPVFEQIASKLGTLSDDTAASIVSFYGASAILRNNINLVISPPILCASRPEREAAVNEHYNALAAWRIMAKALLTQLTRQ